MSRTLQDMRRDLADMTFEGHDFGDLKIEAVNGWEISGPEFTRIFFVQAEDPSPEDPSQTSIRCSFSVLFDPETAVLRQVDFEPPPRQESAAPSF